MARTATLSAHSTHILGTIGITTKAVALQHAHHDSQPKEKDMLVYQRMFYEGPELLHSVAGAYIYVKTPARTKYNKQRRATIKAV